MVHTFSMAGLDRAIQGPRIRRYIQNPWMAASRAAMENAGVATPTIDVGGSDDLPHPPRFAFCEEG